MKSEEHRHMNKKNVKSTIFTTQLILFRDSHENILSLTRPIGSFKRNHLLMRNIDFRFHFHFYNQRNVTVDCCLTSELCIFIKNNMTEKKLKV